MNDNDMIEAFEAWARRHGGIDLQRTADITQQTDGGWHFACYRSHTTEAAWRAWADRGAAPAPVAQGEPVACGHECDCRTYCKRDQSSSLGQHHPAMNDLAALALAAPAPVAPAEFEVRDDGERVRVDRWEVGIRRTVALLWGNRHAFEVDEVVEAVRALVPAPNDDDEDLVRAVLAAPAPVAQHVRCIGRGGTGCGHVGGKSGDTCPNCGGMLLSCEAQIKALKAIVNAPPAAARVPLTLEYIDAHIGPDEGDREAVVAIVREVEQAHGITGQ